MIFKLRGEGGVGWWKFVIANLITANLIYILFAFLFFLVLSKLICHVKDTGAAVL